MQLREGFAGCRPCPAVEQFVGLELEQALQWITRLEKSGQVEAMLALPALVRKTLGSTHADDLKVYRSMIGSMLRCCDITELLQQVVFWWQLPFMSFTLTPSIATLPPQDPCQASWQSNLYVLIYIPLNPTEIFWTCQVEFPCAFG